MNESTFDNLLAMDTSGSNLKLGLSFGGDRLIKSDDRIEKSHGQFLVKKIGELCDSAGIARNMLEGIIVCTGPGSFTGLRIGMATAKGMVVALGMDMVGVSLFELAAHKLHRVEKLVTVIIPLRKTEFACMRIHADSSVGKVVVVTDTELPTVVGSDSVAGIGFDMKGRFPEFGNQDVSSFVEYDAGDLIELGRAKLQAGEVDDAASLEPLYIQKSQAEINFDLRNRS